MKTIRVLVIDDSSVVHALLEKAMRDIPDCEIVGKAFDGESGVKLVLEKHPDVVIMDITMPGMGGLAAIQAIMEEHPLPIIVFSAASKEIVDLSYKAIGSGAVDIVEKPDSQNFDHFKKIISETLVAKIRVFSGIKVVRRRKAFPVDREQRKKPEEAFISGIQQDGEKDFPVIGIASSTGGPQTVRTFVEHLEPGSMNAAIIVVQHMAEGFMEGFRDWIALTSSLPVRTPERGGMPLPGHIYIAPGEYHLVFDNTGRFSSRSDPPVNGIRPSANLFLESLAQTYKRRAVAVVLTGMGYDGSEGVREIKKHGGYVVAQDEESSLIYGMPKAAVDTGCVDRIVSIDELHLALFGPVALKR